MGRSPDSVTTMHEAAGGQVRSDKPILRAQGFRVGGPTNVRTCPHQRSANTRTRLCMMGERITTLLGHRGQGRSDRESRFDRLQARFGSEVGRNGRSGKRAGQSETTSDARGEERPMAISALRYGSIVSGSSHETKRSGCRNGRLQINQPMWPLTECPSDMTWWSR